MSETPIKMRKSLADYLASGCTALLSLGIGAFVLWTAIGWARAPRADAIRFLATTRLFVLLPALLMVVSLVLTNRARLIRVPSLLRPIRGAGDILNLVRVAVLAVAILLLSAGVIAVTPWSAPYVFYDALRVATCFAWVSLLTVAGIKKVAELEDIVLFGCTFLFVFTPVWPLRLSRELWAPIDVLGALALCLALLSVVEHGPAEQDHSTPA